MKTIGVLGGIGPQATMDLEARLHAVSQRLMPQEWGNSGYPPLIVYYHRAPPVAVEPDGRSIQPLSPHPDLLEAARRLGPLVDFLLVTSNGVHEVQADIEAAAGKPMLSMVQCVVDEVTERNWRRVGALTLFGGDMYERALESTVRECLTVEEEIQEPLNWAALAVMAGSETEADKDVARRAVSALRERSVDGIILGCTEFPFLLGDAAEAPDVLNPIKILAEAAVRHAME